VRPLTNAPSPWKRNARVTRAASAPIATLRAGRRTDEHEGAWWISDDNNLTGALRNIGHVRGDVTGVELELPIGGRVVGRFRAEPSGPADGGYVSTLPVRAGGAMTIEFQTHDGSLGTGLAGDVRPRVTVRAGSDDLGWQGTRTIELLRRSGGVNAALRWEPRAVD